MESGTNYQMHEHWGGDTTILVLIGCGDQKDRVLFGPHGTQTAVSTSQTFLVGSPNLSSSIRDATPGNGYRFRSPM
jgi:hypothetical protein